MLTILFNLPSQPPDSLLGFLDFRLAIAEYIGYTADIDLWTTQQQDELGRIVHETYLTILHPTRPSGLGPPHTWSFLLNLATLTTVSGTSTYTMPADFGALHGSSLTYPANGGFVPVKVTSALDIRERLQYSSRSGQPYLYATQWASQVSGLNQRQQIVLYPTPDAAYVLTYQYAKLVNRLSLSNPYPLGGMRMSQLMVEACKAVGEAKKNGKRGDQWSIFEKMLMEAIATDAATNTERTVGSMRDPDGGRFSMSIRSVSGSTYAGIAVP